MRAIGCSRLKYVNRAFSLNIAAQYTYVIRAFKITFNFETPLHITPSQSLNTQGKCTRNTYLVINLYFILSKKEKNKPQTSGYIREKGKAKRYQLYKTRSRKSLRKTLISGSNLELSRERKGEITISYCIPFYDKSANCNITIQLKKKKSRKNKMNKTEK